LLTDVEIFSRAVHQGLEFRELFSTHDVENAKQVLREGQRRAAALLDGMAPWTTHKGLVVRGFRSKIDRTVQPYGLVIFETYSSAGKDKYRLDLWLHGRKHSPKGWIGRELIWRRLGGCSIAEHYECFACGTDFS
jgi:hypothetical protein